MSKMDLKNKVAYITGGIKGIGFGIAKELLKNGLKVAISGRSTEAVEKAVSELSEYENKIIGVVSDVKNFEAEQEAVKYIETKLGNIDVVVANAGLGCFKPVDEISLEEWNAMIDTNLTGAFHTMKATVESLKKTQGYYISIASLAGAYFFEKASGYNASKFGLVGFTQAAMLDLRKYNIKVSTIMPGSVASHFNGNEPSDKDSWKIQPEDLGEIVVDLLRMNPRTLPSKIEVRPSNPNK
ncbi:SDR family oxidoreductase [Riemerella anatipestifer]|uniref:SDR family oxidoreductase n=1 Tax=Riemerella anatipestifer TaxID=34085 RepID=UPI00285D6EB6|nr:SDR family oxidoreductase [Riemerella anatipestifer]MDR7774889.1 SDR family oxidoreductase [Riemerella anatipestifer]MDR7783472.1 SDR family oxidoreductase [Riemerella anatipestifer]MDY3437298.1 SDR family oxidoreductase [Riemerella anatipestifer]MDY3453623.1 SDR family oxidoreductase [Riemerella anatipestifer]